MFNAEILSRNFSHENAYFAFTNKYLRHYKSISEKGSALNFTFLYGAAGTGKTSILVSEYLKRFVDGQYNCLTFNFIPDSPDHNHSLFKDIVLQLLEIEGCSVKSLLKLRTEIEDMALEDTVKDTVLAMISPVYETPGIADKTLSEVTACTFLLRYILEHRKACLMLDDIHLSLETVTKFFQALEDNDVPNLSIVCTTRNTKAQHQFHLKSLKKWMHIEHLDDENASRFGRHVSSSVPLDRNAVLATNGNMYLIKELARLSNQKNSISVRTSVSNTFRLHLNPNNITNSILERRCDFLTDQQSNLLRMCTVLGFSFQKKELCELYEHFYSTPPVQDIDVLIKEGFLRSVTPQEISFDHQITYDFFLSHFSSGELTSLHQKAFHYYRSISRNGEYSSQLARHALLGGLLTFAYIYYKNQAKENMRMAQYTSAAFCYEQCLSIIDKVSIGPKTAQRLLPIYKDQLSAYLILWEHDKSKEISRKLLLLSEQFNQSERLSIHSLITAIHWTLGDFPKALSSSCNVFETSKQLNFSHGAITAGVRCGSLQAEMGFYQECLEFYKETLTYIQEDQRTNKFGLFVSAYPNITSVQAMCYAELGMNEEYISAKDISIRYLNEKIDDFTKLFITTHTGYAYYLNGHFNEARPHLELGFDISNKMKAGLLKSTADGLLGICRIYQGDISGMELLKKSEKHAHVTNQFHKRGMIDLFYLEGLLLTYDLATFSEQIDKKIAFAEKTKQLSFAAWMYFLKAIYFSFYHTSGPGYIGAMAKANMIAETLGLKTLQSNIVSLTILYQSNHYDAAPEKLSDVSFYDKAKFFYHHSANIIPLNRH